MLGVLGKRVRSVEKGVSARCAFNNAFRNENYNVITISRRRVKTGTCNNAGELGERRVRRSADEEGGKLEQLIRHRKNILRKCYTITELRSELKRFTRTLTNMVD